MPDPTGRVSHLPHFHRGVAWKEPVRVATTANITIATALNAGDSIDGVTLAAGDRVLVKDQSTGNQNGIYVAGASPARAYDMDQDGTTTVPAEEIAGAFVYVIAGTANSGKVYHTTNVAGGTLGSTTITWTELSGGSGAPTNADYLVGTANGSLSNEIVVGTSPGGELGGTWASPTVDGTHSGSAHSDFIAKSFVDAKGDLISASANDTPARLAVGSDGQLLSADSTQTTGLKWVAAAASITAKDEGSTLTTAVTSLDFTGAGVVATNSGGAVTVNVPVGGSTDAAGFTVIVKSADQDVVNATLQDDTELLFPVTAGKHYMLMGLFMTSGDNTSGDFAFRGSVTAGTMDGRGQAYFQDTALAIGQSTFSAVAANVTNTIPVGSPADIGVIQLARCYLGFRQNTSNGTFKIQFGNNVAGAGRTSRMGQGSVLYWKQTD